MMCRALIAAVVFCCLGAAAADAQFTITPNGGLVNADGVYRYTNGLAVPNANNLTAVGINDVPTDADFYPTTIIASDNVDVNWWWFRGPGDTREYAFGNGAVAGGPNANGVVVGNATGNLNTGGYDFTVTGPAGLYSFLSEQRWTISRPVGGGVQVVSSNTITNTGNAAAGFTLFHFSDFDPNQSNNHAYAFNAALGGAGVGGFTMNSGGTTVNYIGFGAVAHQGDDATTLINLLSDNAVTNLNNATVGSPGDFGGAYEWTFVLNPGAQIRLNAGFALDAIPVPEPGSLALLVCLVGTAGGYWLVRKR